MKYYLDDKKVNIYPIFLKKVGEGYEGKSYLYEDKCLKIHYLFPKKRVLNYKTADYLKDIDTKRIFLPKELLLNKRNDLCGYTKEYVSDCRDIYDIRKDELIKELIELKNEIQLLSSKYVILNDWMMDNFKYDGMFRFIDPGDYEVDFYKLYGNREFDDIIDSNYDILINFIAYDLIGEIKSKDKFYDCVALKSKLMSYDCIENYFDMNMDKNITLGDYVKTKLL